MNDLVIPSRHLIVANCHDIVGPWVCQQTGGTWAEGMPAIGFAVDSKLVAGVVYDGFNGASINMHVASNGSKRWLNRDFLRFCFDYPFNQLGCRRVTGLVPASNKPAQRFDEHLGFIHEATLKGAHPDGDLLVYRMMRDECRWLDLKRKV